MHVGRKYDGWKIKSHVNFLRQADRDRGAFSKRPNPISGKYSRTNNIICTSDLNWKV
jgi:hypothetical protein